MAPAHALRCGGKGGAGRRGMRPASDALGEAAATAAGVRGARLLSSSPPSADTHPPGCRGRPHGGQARRCAQSRRPMREGTSTAGRNGCPLCPGRKGRETSQGKQGKSDLQSSCHRLTRIFIVHAVHLLSAVFAPKCGHRKRLCVDVGMEGECLSPAGQKQDAPEPAA